MPRRARGGVRQTRPRSAPERAVARAPDRRRAGSKRPRTARPPWCSHDLPGVATTLEAGVGDPAGAAQVIGQRRNPPTTQHRGSQAGERRPERQDELPGPEPGREVVREVGPHVGAVRHRRPPGTGPRTPSDLVLCHPVSLSFSEGSGCRGPRACGQPLEPGVTAGTASWENAERIGGFGARRPICSAFSARGSPQARAGARAPERRAAGLASRVQSVPARSAPQARR